MHGLSNSQHFLIYNLQLSIQEISLQLPFQCQVKIQWGKSNHKAMTYCETKINNNLTYRIIIKNKLVLELNCAYTNSILQPKESAIKIILHSEGKQKLGGIVKFNITQYITNLYSSGVSNYKLNIQNCPDSNAFMIFKIGYKFMLQSQRRSIISKSPSNNNQLRRFTSPKKQVGNVQYEHQFIRFGTNAKKQESDVYKRHLMQNVSNFEEFSCAHRVDSQLVYKNANIDKIDQMKCQIDQMKCQIDQMKCLIDQMKCQLMLKKSQIQINVQNLKLMQKQLDQQRLKNSQNLLNTINQLNKSDLLKRQIQCKNTKLQKQNNYLRQKLIQSQAQLKRLADSFFMRQGKLQTISNDHNQRMNQILKQNDKYKQTIFKMQSQMFALQNQISQTHLPGQQLQNKLQKLQVQNVRLNRKIQLLQNQNHSQEQKYFIIKTQLQRLIAQKHLLIQKFNQSQSQRLKDRQYALTGYGVLHEKCIQKDAQLQYSQNIIQNFNNSLMGLELEKQKQNGLLRKKLQSACNKIQKLQNKQKSQRNYQQELNTLKQVLQSKNIQTQNLKRQLKTKIKELQQKQVSIQDRIQQISEEHRVNIQKLQSELNHKNSSLQNINKQIADQNVQIQQLRQKLMSHLTQNKKYNIGSFSSQRHKKQILNLKDEIKLKQQIVQMLKVQNQRKNWTLSEFKQVNVKNNNKIYELQQEVKDLKLKVMHQNDGIKELVSKNLSMTIQMEKQKSRDSINSKS